jgi:hypothetical protein
MSSYRNSEPVYPFISRRFNVSPGISTWESVERGEKYTSYPFCGTPLSQLPESLQLFDVPPPVHVVVWAWAVVAANTIERTSSGTMIVGS